MAHERIAALGVVALLVLAACSQSSVVPPSTSPQVAGGNDPYAEGADDADDDVYDPGAGEGNAPEGDPGGGQLVGIWIGEGTDILGNQAVIETVLEPGGRFSQTTYSSGDPIWITGTYRLIDEATIRFTIEDHTRRWCGPLGCQDLYFQDGETTFFEFVDADTMVTWGYQNPARQVHRRVG